MSEAVLRMFVRISPSVISFARARRHIIMKIEKDYLAIKDTTDLNKKGKILDTRNN